MRNFTTILFSISLLLSATWAYPQPSVQARDNSPGIQADTYTEPKAETYHPQTHHGIYTRDDSDSQLQGICTKIYTEQGGAKKLWGPLQTMIEKARSYQRKTTSMAEAQKRLTKKAHDDEDGMGQEAMRHMAALAVYDMYAWIAQGQAHSYIDALS
jgi:hypothetical protein